MPITDQNVKTDDPLRYTRIELFDSGTATAATDQDGAVVRGLSDTGGTIIGVYARAGTAPTGTVTQLTYDIHKNGTTIFTTASNRVIFTSGASTANSETIEVAAVANDDLLTLDCDAIGDGAAGANVGVTIVIRRDAAND